jgi:hypothetical protein
MEPGPWKLPEAVHFGALKQVRAWWDLRLDALALCNSVGQHCPWWIFWWHCVRVEGMVRPSQADLDCQECHPLYTVPCIFPWALTGIVGSNLTHLCILVQLGPCKQASLLPRVGSLSTLQICLTGRLGDYSLDLQSLCPQLLWRPLCLCWPSQSVFPTQWWHILYLRPQPSPRNVRWLYPLFNFDLRKHFRLRLSNVVIKANF